MPPIWLIYVIQAIMVVASIAMQQKAAANARKIADNAKGLEVPVEAEVKPIPVCYGRNIVGGIRVFHATSSFYVHSGPGFGGVALVSGNTTPQVTYQTTSQPGADSPSVVEETIAPTALAADKSGSKNEFFYIEQALCMGGINKIVDVQFANDRYYDHPDFIDRSRVHMYTDGGVADPMIVANFSSDTDPKLDRRNAFFTGLAHAHAVIKLNRDAPQFNGVPELRFMIEGMKVRRLLHDGNGNYSLTAENNRSYSTNPAECLLDYLMSPTYGKGVAIESIDLESFYKASVVCSEVVMAQAEMGGHIWSPSEDGGNNVAVSSVGDAFLQNNAVWLPDSKAVQFDRTYQFVVDPGKHGDYTLTCAADDNCRVYIKYAGAATEVEVGGTNNWRDLSVTTVTLSAGVHRVHVVANNAGKAASVACQIKKDGEVLFDLRNPIPFTKYDLPRFEANITLDQQDSLRDNVEKLLDTMHGAQLVWSGGTYRLNLQYPKNIGELVVAGNLTDDDILAETATIKWPNASERWNFCTVKYSNEGLNFKDDSVSWPPKYPYSAFPGSDYQNSLYKEYFEADGQVALETDFFAPGIKDRYHALAKAEEIVRKSRGLVTYSFSIRFSGIIYEPGDILYVDSDVLQIPGEYMSVQEIKIDDKGVVAIVATRFDFAGLAWNVADNVNYIPANIYQHVLRFPTNITYDPATQVISWEDVPTTAATTYEVFYWYGGPNLRLDGSVAISEAAMNQPFVFTAVLGRYYETLFGGQQSIALIHEWLSRLIVDNSASSLQQMISRSYTYAEVQTRNGQPWFTPGQSNSEFVDTLYLSTFGGLPDGEGKAFWVGQLERGVPRADITIMIHTETADSNYIKIGETKNREFVTPVFTAGGLYGMAVIGVSSQGKKSAMGHGSRLYEINKNIGVTSPNITTVTLYNRTVTPPDVPVNVSFDFATLGFLGLAGGWSNTIPPGPDPLYITTAFATATLPATVDSALEWSAPEILSAMGVDGLPAPLIATVYLYKRSLTEPDAPTGISFDFSLFSFTTLTEGWTALSDTTGTAALYVISAMITATLPTTLVSDIVWDTPIILAANGQDGNGFNIIGELANAGLLPGTGTTGDAYVIAGELYTWNGTGWSNVGPIQGESYDLKIISSNGNMFKPGQSMTTTLTARVFRNDVEITDTLSAANFKWTRVSYNNQSPPNDDATWNSNHMSGYKSIVLTLTDVWQRATFTCELVN